MENPLKIITSNDKEEKKVEFLELIYDLIFVYVLGRNNSLLHSLSGGFVSAWTFMAYILGSLVAIQIWMFSTYYINMFGRNKTRDHIFLFINMYLLYYIAEGTRQHWEGYVTQYYVAWALILVNIGIQYLIESRNHRGDPGILRMTKRMAAVLFGEAVIVLTELAFFEKAGGWIASTAILFGVFGTIFAGTGSKEAVVDFSHLSERAMLYVVFTFGEMIIAIASYFIGGFSASSVYFSLMAFLIVVGLFLSYEMIYDHIIDRELRTTGMSYMIVHIALIFALNNITTSLEFMRDEEVSLLPKTVFLILAFTLCYICLLSLGRYSTVGGGMPGRVLARFVATGAGFVVLMLLFRNNMWVNVALTCAFVFVIFLMLRHFASHIAAHQKDRLAAAPEDHVQSVNKAVE